MNPQDFHTIATEITQTLGKILVTHPYVGIIDYNGTIYHIDEPLQPFLDVMKNFVTSNFNLLQIGDHSFPLGAVNIAFFKVSSKAMVVLYTLKGLAGQLLAFKMKMFDWTKRIDGLLDQLNIPPPPIPTQKLELEIRYSGTSKPQFRSGITTVPILIKKLKGKEKFSIEVAQVLQFCDGKHTLHEICEETGYSLLKVNEILRDYKKKKWVEIKRTLLQS